LRRQSQPVFQGRPDTGAPWWRKQWPNIPKPKYLERILAIFTTDDGAIFELKAITKKFGRLVTINNSAIPELFPEGHEIKLILKNSAN